MSYGAYGASRGKITHVVRSELMDERRNENKRQNNRLSKEYQQLEKAHKVMADDIAKQKHLLTLSINKANYAKSPRPRGERAYLQSGHGYDMVTSAPGSWERYGSVSGSGLKKVSSADCIVPRTVPAARKPVSGSTGAMNNKQSSKYARGIETGSRRPSIDAKHIAYLTKERRVHGKSDTNIIKVHSSSDVSKSGRQAVGSKEFKVVGTMPSHDTISQTESLGVQ